MSTSTKLNQPQDRILNSPNTPSNQVRLAFQKLTSDEQKQVLDFYNTSAMKSAIATAIRDKDSVKWNAMSNDEKRTYFNDMMRDPCQIHSLTGKICGRLYFAIYPDAEVPSNKELNDDDDNDDDDESLEQSARSVAVSTTKATSSSMMTSVAKSDSFKNFASDEEDVDFQLAILESKRQTLIEKKQLKGAMTRSVQEQHMVPFRGNQREQSMVSYQPKIRQESHELVSRREYDEQALQTSFPPRQSQQAHIPRGGTFVHGNAYNNCTFVNNNYTVASPGISAPTSGVRMLPYYDGSTPIPATKVDMTVIPGKY